MKMPRNATNLIKFYIKFGIQGCDCHLKIWYFQQMRAISGFIGVTPGKRLFSGSKQQNLRDFWGALEGHDGPKTPLNYPKIFVSV